jgi:hypothetical protein
VPEAKKLNSSGSSNHFDLVRKLLIENKFGGVADTVSLLMNTAMQRERSRCLQAERWIHTRRTTP